jgi:hypothetical protein
MELLVVRLFVAERRQEFRDFWQRIFADVGWFTLMDCDFVSLASRADVDAVLLPGVFVHERFGGAPIVGVSQVLSTRSIAGWPPWAVTTAPLAATWKICTLPGGTLGLDVREVEPLSSEVKVHRMFTECLRAICTFNEGRQEAPIRCLGLHPETAGLPLVSSSACAETAAVRRAWVTGPPAA